MDNSNKQNNKQNNPNSNQESKSTSKASAQQDELQQAAPNSSSGATVVHSSAWRRLLAKKWAYPALYIAAVAIILTVMWAYQGADKVPLVDGQQGDPALTVSDQIDGEGLVDDHEHLPVAGLMETMNWPVADFNQIEVLVPFFDSEGTSEAQQAATIQYGNTFQASLGMSLSRQDDEPFDVLAALSGTVTRVENHPILGHIVEITHDDGFKTVYQSLSNVTVLAQEQVEQGDVIAQAGRNELGKDLGVHLHFEVYQDGHPIDPQAFINGS